MEANRIKENSGGPTSQTSQLEMRIAALEAAARAGRPQPNNERGVYFNAGRTFPFSLIGHTINYNFVRLKSATDWTPPLASSRLPLEAFTLFTSTDITKICH